MACVIQVVDGRLGACWPLARSAPAGQPRDNPGTETFLRLPVFGLSLGSVTFYRLLRHAEDLQAARFSFPCGPSVSRAQHMSVHALTRLISDTRAPCKPGTCLQA